MLVLLLSSVSGYAQVPVVFARGSSDDAVQFAAERTGLPADQLIAAPLSDLLAAAPAAVGPTSLRHCPYEPTELGALHTEVARAEGEWREGDAEAALVRLDGLVVAVGCLGQVVDGPAVARGLLAKGALYAADGSAEAAREEMVTALALDPSLAWLEGLPDAGREVHQGLVDASAEDRRTVSFLPPSAAAGPWLDGHEVAGDVSVTAGLHLFQYATPAGIRTAWLPVSEDTTVVTPGAFRPDALDAMGTPAGGATVGGLLAAARPDDDSAYVIDGGGLWLVVRRGRDVVVSEIVPRPPPAPPETPKERRRRERAERKARKPG